MLTFSQTHCYRDIFGFQYFSPVYMGSTPSESSVPTTDSAVSRRIDLNEALSVALELQKAARHIETQAAELHQAIQILLESISRSDFDPSRLTPIHLLRLERETRSSFAEEMGAALLGFEEERHRIEKQLGAVRHLRAYTKPEKWNELYRNGRRREAILLCSRFGTPQDIFQVLDTTDASEVWRTLDQVFLDEISPPSEVDMIYAFLQQSASTTKQQESEDGTASS